MKLTNYFRDAFIRSVMNDVPTIDYDTQLRNAVMKAAIERMPEEAQKLWKDPKTKDYICTGRLYVGSRYIGDIPGADEWRDLLCASEEETNAFFAQFDELVKKDEEQTAQRETLQQKVRAVAYSCTTDKQLLEKLPEFEKYLPKEVKSARDVPAIANLVKDLIEAGWPDGGKKKLEPAEA